MQSQRESMRTLTGGLLLLLSAPVFTPALGATEWGILGNEVHSEVFRNLGAATEPSAAALDVRSTAWTAIRGERYQAVCIGTCPMAYGGYFTANSFGDIGVYGHATATGAASGNQGGRFEAGGGQGIGVYGGASHTGPGRNVGGYFKAHGEKGVAVYGGATSTADSLNQGGRFEAAGAKGIGVYGRASHSGAGRNIGGYFKAHGHEGIAVYARAYGIVGTGLYARGSSYAAVLRGKIQIQNSAGQVVSELGEGLDYAEGFPVSDPSQVTPGTVLVIDPDNPGRLTVSSRSYDTRVAGIASGAKGLGPGVRLGNGPSASDVALAGRLYCNVDATEQPIRPGDLLTTSDTPGHAMKASDPDRSHGAILGKAMEALDKGKKGQILVLVALQ